MDLQGLKIWFEGCVNATKNKNPFWVLKKGAKIVFSNFTEKDLDNSWHLLEMMVNEQARNGARSLEIICKSSPTDPNPKYWPLEIPYGYSVKDGNKPGTQTAALHGLPSMNMNIGEIQRIQKEAHQQQLQAERDRAARELADFKRQVEHEKQLEALKGEIAAVKESQQSGIERFFSMLEENSNVCAPIVQGVMSSFFPQIQVSGPSSYQQNVPAPDEEAELEGIQEDQDEEQGIDFNPAINAVLILHQAGWKNPSDILLRVAQFAVKNPEQAKMLLNQL